MTFLNKDTKLIIANNIKNYLAAVGKSNEWVIERSGIQRACFYNLLEGKGDFNISIPKLNKLFRIKDPFYFYNENIILPRSLEEIEKNDSVAIGFNSDSKEFKETLAILDEVIDMIHLLKSAKEVG